MILKKTNNSKSILSTVIKCRRNFALSIKSFEPVGQSLTWQRYLTRTSSGPVIKKRDFMPPVALKPFFLGRLPKVRFSF